MIPGQLKGYNFVPVLNKNKEDNKGTWSLSKNKIIDMCRYLDFPFSEFPDEAWSENGAYVSWTSMPYVPATIKDHILKVALKKGQDLVIKTGLQPDGRFI